MKSLIVDTNRIIAALVKDSFSRILITSSPVAFFTIGFSKQEIIKHKEELMKRTDLDESAFDALLGTLYNKLNIIADTILEPYLEEAKKIMETIDPDDVQFIAAALATSCDGIWSDDKHFQKQHRVKVWTTKELLEELLTDS